MHAERWFHIERTAILVVAALGTFLLIQALADIVPDWTSHRAGDALLGLAIYSPLVLLAVAGAGLAWALSWGRAGRRAVIVWSLFAMVTTLWLMPMVGTSGLLAVVMSPDTRSWSIEWPLLVFTADDGATGVYDLSHLPYLFPLVVAIAAVVALGAALRAPTIPRKHHV